MSNNTGIRDIFDMELCHFFLQLTTDRAYFRLLKFREQTHVNVRRVFIILSVLAFHSKDSACSARSNSFSRLSLNNKCNFYKNYFLKNKISSHEIS